MTTSKDRKGLTRRYENGEIAIVWQPDLCIHSANCIAGLPHVFNPRKRPWVAIHAASTDELVETVMTCPSGALSFERIEKPSS
jgi:uncharacterized Fe-S cluster protein YjdI